MQEITHKTLITYKDSPYYCYCVPGVVVTASGAIITYFETRTSPAEHDARGVGMMRSEDEGETWSPMEMIASSDGDDAVNSPVMIASKNGDVHFLYVVNYRRGVYCKSTDDGKTFGEPVEITSCIERFRTEADLDWRQWAVGPGHAIELSDGRLYVPIWAAREAGGEVTSAIVSSDQGKSWNIVEVIEPENRIRGVREPCVVQLDDGSVMMNLRNTIDPGMLRYRAATVSQDGETGFSVPKCDLSLPDPGCYAGMAKIKNPALPDGSGILFVNCNHTPCELNGYHHGRIDLTMRLSIDNGKTWKYSRWMDNIAGYADVATSPDGKWMYCFYEHGREINGISSDIIVKRLTFAKGNLEWLTDGELE